MKPTRLLVILLITILAFGAVSCAKEADSAATFDPTVPYTVTIGAYGDLEKAYSAVFASADFKAKFPNVTIQFQTSDFGGHHNRLTTVLAANEQANDIEALEVGFIAQFVETGGLTDLNAAPFNAKKVSGDIVKFAMANATTTKDNLIAMPVDIAPAVLFYREDLARNAGANLDNLASWDEYIEVMKKLADPANGVYAIEHPAAVQAIPLNGGKGGWMDNGKPLEPKAKFLDALKLVQKVKAANVDGDLGAWSGPWSQAYLDGKVATIVNGAWFGGTLRTWLSPEPGKWRVAYLPGKMMASLGGTYLSIPATTPEDRKLVAWEIIKYLTTSSNAQLITFREIDAFPALTSVYKDPVMDEDVAFYGGQKVRKIFADVALNIPENKVTEYDNVILSIWNGSVTAVVNGTSTPEEAYDEALTKVKATIF
ncbi:MAG: extracellular solute-binding protein [Spirochaetes bacterium]|nr:extracellular solute-binding protein [Spirochaetota bacterium]MBU0954578.1 extracellular solute-binding protein [Spirochaetota bacterium]